MASSCASVLAAARLRLEVAALVCDNALAVARDAGRLSEVPADWHVASAMDTPEAVSALMAQLKERLGEVPANWAHAVGSTLVAPLHRTTEAQVAAVMERAHIGILTSHYEGMPCFLLELLASGRPFGGVRLPQFAPLVETAAAVALAARPRPDSLKVVVGTSP